MEPNDINNFPEPMNPWPSETPERTDGHCPNFSVVEAIIKEGMEKSLANGEPSIKVEIDGKTKFLSRFLASDLYKFGLSEAETSELLDRYLYTHIDGEHITTPVKPQRALGRTATHNTGGGKEFDFRERQAGSYKDFE